GRHAHQAHHRPGHRPPADGDEGADPGAQGAAAAGRHARPAAAADAPGGPPVSDVVLSVLAHPDDAEFLCAGTLIRLAGLGGQVPGASMAPGACGGAGLPPGAIAGGRRAEGVRAAALLGAAYHCLEERDLRIFYAERPLEKVVGLLRTVRPTVVLTHSPADYM